MTTLRHLITALGYTREVYPGRFGVEIETEVLKEKDYPKGFLTQLPDLDQDGHTQYKTDLSAWDAKSDGSLRNFGIEYVLKQPLSYTETVTALRDFQEKTKEVKFLEDQASTSVHVHMNFMDEKLLTLANYSVGWFLFENLLLEFSGPTRRSNLFAAGARVADSQVANFVKLFKGLEQGNPQAISFQQNHVKYAALNLGTLFKLGSLEARSFRGTCDTEEIIIWLSLLNQLFDFARTPGLTPARLLQSYKEKDAEILSDVFGSYSSVLKCDGYVEMIERNLKYVYDMVTSVKNWDTFGLAFNEVKPLKTRKPKNDVNSQMTEYASLLGLNPAMFQYTPPPAQDASPWAMTGMPGGSVAIETATVPDELDMPDFDDDDNF